MKALTLYQPWATLVAIGAKKIETRSWGTSYRGPLAIHAGKNKRYVDMKGKDYICDVEPFYRVLESLAREKGHLWEFGNLPLGKVIATCDLVSVKQIDGYDWVSGQVGWTKGQQLFEASEQERFFGDHRVGRYMWFLANIKMLAEPIQAEGAQRLWDWNCPHLWKDGYYGDKCEICGEMIPFGHGPWMAK